MSILYPRTISIRRESTITPPAQQGQIGYGGAAPVSESIIASGLSASIQYERVGRENPSRLPTDTRRSTWLILIPLSDADFGLITENDIVLDDLGKRYQVYAADFQPLGYNLHAELLNV